MKLERFKGVIQSFIEIALIQHGNFQQYILLGSVKPRQLLQGNIKFEYQRYHYHRLYLSV